MQKTNIKAEELKVGLVVYAEIHRSLSNLKGWQKSEKFVISYKTSDSFSITNGKVGWNINYVINNGYVCITSNDTRNMSVRNSPISKIEVRV